MTETDEVLEFAGLTRFDQGDVPDGAFGHHSSMRWWAAEGRNSDAPKPEDFPDAGLVSRMNELPRASTAEVLVRNPVSGETYATQKHNAVINPETIENVEWGYGNRLEVLKDKANEDPRTVEAVVEDEGLDDAISALLDSETAQDVRDMTVGDDALYHIPTDDYEIINPSEFLNPLGEVVRDEGLQDDLFGEFRLHRNGGRVSADVFFDGKHVQAPGLDDDRKPIVVGLQLDWDFFGDTAVRIQGVGMDWECVNAIRSITETITVKHSGDVDERVDWASVFEEMMEELDLKVDQLSQVIQEASNEHLDVSDLPDNFGKDHDSVLEAIYDYAGLPNYLAEHAARNLRAQAADPFDPSWWEIHRGATFAVTHHGRGDVGSGGAIQQYNRLANDMLVNPAGVGERMEENFAAEREEEADTLEGEAGGRAEVAQAFESVREKKEKYEEREEQIQEMIEA